MPTPRMPREVSARSSSSVVVVAVLVIVVVGAVVMVIVVVAVPASEPLPKDAQPDRDDEQPGRQRQPRVELLGHDEAREQERHEPEREHAGGVRDGHRRSERDRVAGRPRVPTRYPATSAFPCPGVSARRAPERRDEQREQDDPRREVAALDQRLEAAATVGGSRRRRASGPAQECCRREVRVRRADVERRAEQVARVGPELVRAARPGRTRRRAARRRVRRR